MSEYIDGEYAERTRLREAEWLAEQRRRDPSYDPWKPPPGHANAGISSDQDGRDAAGGMADTGQPETATQQAPEPFAGMAPRDALRRAQEAHRAALAARDRAAELVERATGRVDSAAQQVQEFADLDARLIDFHVQQIKAGHDHDLPVALGSAQKQRGQAADRLDAAQKALLRLQGELRTAEQQVQQALQQLQAAATRVITQHAEQLAAELADAERDACDKRTQLLSLARSWLPSGQSGPTALPPAAHRVITSEPPHAHEDPDAIARWRDWHQRLVDDANAAWQDGADAHSSAT